MVSLEKGRGNCAAKLAEQLPRVRGGRVRGFVGRQKRAGEVEGKRKEREEVVERQREARVKTRATARVYAVNEVNIGDFWIDWVRGWNSCLILDKDKYFIHSY